MWHVELPLPGIEPMPPAVEAQSLNHWTTGEVPVPEKCLLTYGLVCHAKSYEITLMDLL